MRRIQTVVATLSLATLDLVAGTAGAADQASPPVVSRPEQPAADAAKITKSRSNIQNNRQTAPAANQADESPAQSKSVVKTKTKSNQSND